MFLDCLEITKCWTEVEKTLDRKTQNREINGYDNTLCTVREERQGIGQG